MSVEKFQEGGFVDEDELFTDDIENVVEDGAEGSAPLKGELVENNEGEQAAPEAEAPEAEMPGTVDPPEAPEVNPEGADLSGVDLFLANYGVKGGVIQFEDGETARFVDLPPQEQETILKSLVKDAIPTVEEKYNLDEEEINLINSYRESNTGHVGEFLNNIVDSRLNAYIQSKEAVNIDFDKVADDDIFITHLRQTKPDLSDEDIADALNKSKELVTYDSTIAAIRDSYKSKQRQAIAKQNEAEKAAFYDEVESQREEVVNAIADVDYIAGAKLTDDIKEYLLGDILELNDNNDPILMEKIFSDPNTMFKTSWFLNYGEDYINNLNDYWKKQVSAAYKQGYEKSINGMPDNPTIIGADNRRKDVQNNSDQSFPGGFGEEVTEEDLFD